MYGRLRDGVAAVGRGLQPRRQDAGRGRLSRRSCCGTWSAGKLAKRIGAGQIGTMVQAVLFSKDGKSLAVAEGTPYAAGAVKVFDLQTGQVAMNFQEPKGAVFCAGLEPRRKTPGRRLQRCRGLRLEPGGKEARDHAEGPHPGGGQCLPSPPDGKYLATASLDKTVQVWDVATWKPDRNKTTLEAPVHRCCLRDSGQRGRPARP